MSNSGQSPPFFKSTVESTALTWLLELGWQVKHGFGDCPRWAFRAVLSKLGLRGIIEGEMVMAKRKGSERNWREYNEHLVKRGEILLDLESEGLEKRTL